MIITPPTYGMYPVCAQTNDVAVKKVPLKPSFLPDPDAILSQVDANTKMIFLCSPGNPTSLLVPLSVVSYVASRFRGIVIVDEAYIDFQVDGTAVGLTKEHDNIVVLQTLSKVRVKLRAIPCLFLFRSSDAQSNFALASFLVRVMLAALPLLFLFRSSEARSNFALAPFLVRVMLAEIRRLFLFRSSFLLNINPNHVNSPRRLDSRGSAVALPSVTLPSFS